MATEQQYIDQFRKLVAARNQVLAAIANVRGLCDALKNWQQAADHLLGSSVHHDSSPWHPDRLKDVTNIRQLLEAYQKARNETVRLWRELGPDRQDGLAEPSSLDRG